MRLLGIVHASFHPWRVTGENWRLVYIYWKWGRGVSFFAAQKPEIPLFAILPDNADPAMGNVVLMNVVALHIAIAYQPFFLLLDMRHVFLIHHGLNDLE